MTTLTEARKTWIDNASYHDLLLKWRFASSSPLLELDSGKYFAKVMEEKKSKLSHKKQVQISKDIGW